MQHFFPTSQAMSRGIAFLAKLILTFVSAKNKLYTIPTFCDVSNEISYFAVGSNCRKFCSPANGSGFKYFHPQFQIQEKENSTMLLIFLNSACFLIDKMEKNTLLSYGE